MAIKQKSVYRNLHKPGMFSIKQSGKVIDWATTISLKGNIVFHVNENGRIKVTKERKKNVHSWIKADEAIVLDDTPVLDNYKELWYDPYYTQFYYCLSGKKVIDAEEVIMANNRAYALNPVYAIL